MDGRPVGYSVSASLDGRQILSGQRVSIGQHSFTVSHPKAESFSTNLFVWYGEHGFGEIALRRATGTLSIQAEPPSALLTIRGPEFTLTLTNSAGVTLSVPTDRYEIEAMYRHWRGLQEIIVSPNAVAPWRCVPRIGNLQLSCNQTGATFQLVDAGGNIIGTGELPSIITELPEGRYKMIAVHHDKRQEVSGFVETGMTRDIKARFIYGAALLDTKPAGARVINAYGQSPGVTPLLLKEVDPGHFDFVLERNGYESARVSLEVAANQTNSFSTNLTSTSYLRAMEGARQYLKEANYQRAWEASGEALAAVAGDPDAAAIQREAAKQESLIRAKLLGAKGDYDGATGELEAALLTVPEDGELKQLLTAYRKRKEERAERLRPEQTSHATLIFKAVLGNNKDAGLFEHHELKSGKPFGEVESAIRTALQNQQPIFTVNELKSPEADVFVLEAKQQLPSGMRQCLIVGGQTLPDETQIFFEVLEYTTGQSVTVLGVVSLKSDLILTPVNPSRVEQMTPALRSQVDEGIRMVMGLLQRAVQ